MRGWTRKFTSANITGQSLETNHNKLKRRDFASCQLITEYYDILLLVRILIIIVINYPIFPKELDIKVRIRLLVVTLSLIITLKLLH